MRTYKRVLIAVQPDDTVILREYDKEYTEEEILKKIEGNIVTTDCISGSLVFANWTLEDQEWLCEHLGEYLPSSHEEQAIIYKSLIDFFKKKRGKRWKYDPKETKQELEKIIEILED